ncbi:MAG: hypothetical protein ACREJ5_04345 [Geminicoccaceae bacterium]
MSRWLWPTFTELRLLPRAGGIATDCEYRGGRRILMRGERNVSWDLTLEPLDDTVARRRKRHRTVIRDNRYVAALRRRRGGWE